ncbi:hypothetical protein ACQQ2Q_12180 [Agrobacterium sp. ES01]|uniref:hypothetical protein n=1 Tax=Agrobacterium sp. ES01 TaxID=3420714 RepID=UPI003D102A2E
MSTKTGIDRIISVSGTDRAMNAPEVIDRLAEQLRASGDMDLPHSYYVEEVKLRLAGRDLRDRATANDAERIIRRETRASTSSVFHSWAMRD